MATTKKAKAKQAKGQAGPRKAKPPTKIRAGKGPKEFYAARDETGALVDRNGDPLDLASTRTAVLDWPVVAKGNAVPVGPLFLAERDRA